MRDRKQDLAGFPEAELLTAAGLDGWYLVESSPWTRTVMSWQRQTPVATGVRTTDAESIVADHNKRLLARPEAPNGRG